MVYYKTLTERYKKYMEQLDGMDRWLPEPDLVYTMDMSTIPLLAMWKIP